VGSSATTRKSYRLLFAGEEIGLDRFMDSADSATSFRGRITAEEVQMLPTLLEQERSRVPLDVKDVLLVDREAIKLLAFRESNGAELRNCPAYIRHWVTRERAA
jgi:hypothetical protein